MYAFSFWAAVEAPMKCIEYSIGRLRRARNTFLADKQYLRCGVNRERKYCSLTGVCYLCYKGLPLAMPPVKSGEGKADIPAPAGARRQNSIRFFAVSSYGCGGSARRRTGTRRRPEGA